MSLPRLFAPSILSRPPRARGAGPSSGPPHGLRRILRPVAALAAVVLAGALAPAGASPIHRCESDGAVTFQNTPCADGRGGRFTPQHDATSPAAQPASTARNQAAYRAAAAPALAEERARLGSAGPGSAGPGRPGAAPRASLPATASAAAALPSTAPRSPAAGGAFRCDGRQHCSQMRSCAEARYFLARCPDVKMDGDGDGIPCEEQLCGH
ncbi:MAG: hypothetical protein RIQ53_4637 [Pseudomonadota bacterium]